MLLSSADSHRKDRPSLFPELPSEQMKGNRHKSQMQISIRENVPHNEDDQMLQWDPEEWEKYSSLKTPNIQLKNLT